MRAGAPDARPAQVPEGAYVYPIANPAPTRWFGFLLLPEFTLHAFSAALDPLRIANQLAQRSLYGWRVLSEDGAPVRSSSGVPVGVDGAFGEAQTMLPVFICSGNHWRMAARDRTVAQIRQRARFGGQHGGICTGAGTLARADLLEGKRFTLHWENQPGFIETFPTLTPTRNRHEADGSLLTCGGGSAATEMMLLRIEADYGTAFATLVADMCLFEPANAAQRDQRSSIATAVSSRNPKLVQVVQKMYQTVESPLPMADLARQVGVSRRQMERLFRTHLDAAPNVIYRNIRLERARALLVETDNSVMAVAVATGFNSVSVFTRHYKARFGVPPSGARHGL